MSDPLAEPDQDDGTFLAHTPMQPMHFNAKLMTGLIVGALVGTLTTFATNLALGVVVGIVVCLALWGLGRLLIRPRPPIDRMRMVILSTRNFTVTPVRSKEVLARRSIADFDRYELRRGFGIWRPARIALVFDDGEVWRGEAGIGLGLEDFVHALNEG